MRGPALHGKNAERGCLFLVLEIIAKNACAFMRNSINLFRAQFDLHIKEVRNLYNPIIQAGLRPLPRERK
jgi:hypothetical protein